MKAILTAMALMLLTTIIMATWFMSQGVKDQESMAKDPSVENTLRVWNKRGE